MKYLKNCWKYRHYKLILYKFELISLSNDTKYSLIHIIGHEIWFYKSTSFWKKLQIFGIKLILWLVLMLFFEIQYYLIADTFKVNHLCAFNFKRLNLILLIFNVVDANFIKYRSNVKLCFQVCDNFPFTSSLCK